MLRAILVAVILAVATFDVIKCDDAKCSDKNSKQSVEFMVDFDAVSKGDIIKKTLTKGVDNVPFDSEVTIAYNSANGNIKVTPCTVMPKKDGQLFLKEIDKKYFPVEIEIVNQKHVERKKCGKNNNLMNIYNLWYVNPIPVNAASFPQCADADIPRSRVINHKENFLSGNNMIVKMTYRPSYPECKEEYLKHKGTYLWNIRPYSQFKYNFQQGVLTYYAGPSMYTSPNGYRMMPYMYLQFGQNDEATATIGSFAMAGPFTDQMKAQAEISLPNDPSQPMQSMKSGAQVTFKIPKEAIKKDTLQIKIHLVEEQ